MNEMLEEERQRLSIFLHDEILQDLIALSHSIKMEGTEERLSSIIGEIRHISQELYPTIVEDLGLEQSLSLLIDDIGNDYNVGLEYKYHYPQGILPKGISLVIYRTVKELVTNAIKHSKCNQISIIINQIPEGIECIVSDNGIGFQISENEESLKSPHMGLNTVRRQIANSNGNMRIISDKTGSEFHIHIPLR
jgi:two-component system sensor histidine kinase ComP